MKIFKLRYNEQGSARPRAAVVVADDPAEASSMVADLFDARIELCCVDKIGDGFPPARVVLDGPSRKWVDDVPG
jgi:hypothetical protein